MDFSGVEHQKIARFQKTVQTACRFKQDVIIFHIKGADLFETVAAAAADDGFSAADGDMDVDILFMDFVFALFSGGGIGVHDIDFEFFSVELVETCFRDGSGK